jgi:hypothetical protein
VRLPRWLVRAQAEPAPARRQLGASGTIIQDGWLVSSEYSPDLRGVQGLRVYDRMRRSDASVREALGHVFAPLLNARWEVEPAGESDLDLEVAAFCEAALFGWMRQPWSELLRTILLYLPQGFQVFELVEEVEEYELRVGDRVVPRRPYLVWRRWAHRRPETIIRWMMEGGELRSVVQRVFTGRGYEDVEIPADRLVVFTNEREGDDLTGMSVLRSAVKPWMIKEVVEKVAGISTERYGAGIPVGYVPERFENDREVVDRVEQMLRDLRAGEFSYLVFPGPKQMANRDGYLFEIVAPTGNPPDFSGLLTYLRGEVKASVLARFSELGHGTAGARATGDVQSEVWYDALHATATYVADVVSEALRRLVDGNYPGVTAYPRLVPRNIEGRGLIEFADYVAKTMAVGALIPDKSLREAVRKAGDIPPEGEDAQLPPQVEEDPTLRAPFGRLPEQGGGQ